MTGGFGGLHRQTNYIITTKFDKENLPLPSPSS